MNDEQLAILRRSAVAGGNDEEKIDLFLKWVITITVGATIISEILKGKRKVILEDDGTPIFDGFIEENDVEETG